MAEVSNLPEFIPAQVWCSPISHPRSKKKKGIPNNHPGLATELFTGDKGCR
jgi:hypothetical protein